MAKVVKVTETSNGNDLVRFAHEITKTIAGVEFKSSPVFYMFCNKGDFEVNDEFEAFDELLKACDVTKRPYTHDNGETTITNWLTLKM